MNMILETLEKFNIIGKDSKRVGTGIILVSIGLPLLWFTLIFWDTSSEELAGIHFLEWAFLIIIFTLFLVLPSVIVWAIHTCKNKGVRRILSFISISVITYLILGVNLKYVFNLPWLNSLIDGMIYLLFFGVVFVLPWLSCKLLHWFLAGFTEGEEL